MDGRTEEAFRGGSPRRHCNGSSWDASFKGASRIWGANPVQRVAGAGRMFRGAPELAPIWGCARLCSFCSPGCRCATLTRRPATERVIALADHPLDTHGERRVKGAKLKELERPYGISYDCLLPNEYDNLIAASRGASFSYIAASACRLSRTRSLRTVADQQPKKLEVAGADGQVVCSSISTCRPLWSS